MYKLIGVIFIVMGAGGFGIAKGYGFFVQLNNVKAFSDALQLLKCEMNYTLSPLSKLCATVSKRTKGTCSVFFREYSRLLADGIPRSLAVQRLLSDERKYRLPKDAQLTLLELFEGIGAYEIEGENQRLRIAVHRLQASAQRLEQEKKPLAKSYAALGICLGLALVILFI